MQVVWGSIYIQNYTLTTGRKALGNEDEYDSKALIQPLN